MPQLHIDLHEMGVFVGLAIPVKTEEYKSCMASWFISYPAHALKMLRKLDKEHVHFLPAGDEDYDVSELDADEITSIGERMMDETEWTSWGEFYHHSEKNILGISAFAGRALTVFRKVLPVFEVAMGFSEVIPILKLSLKHRASSKIKRTSRTPPSPSSTQQERVEYDSKERVIERNPEVVAWVKKIEESNCQVCGKTILFPNGQKTIDVHHIWPLGSPHDGYELGFDCTENAICLCPNHHREMDNGVFHIEPQTLKIIYHDDSNEYHGVELRIHPNHGLSEEYLEYHCEFIFEKWNY